MKVKSSFYETVLDKYQFAMKSEAELEKYQLAIKKKRAKESAEREDPETKKQMEQAGPRAECYKPVFGR